MAGQINLYDPTLRKKRDWLTLGNLVLGAAVMLVIIIGAGVFARSGLAELRSQAAEGETRLKQLRAQVEALAQNVEGQKPDAHLERELVAKRRLLEMRGRVLQGLRQRLTADAPGFADFLRGLANLTMPGVWITAFVWDATNNDMEIRGRTTDPALLPEYLRRLNREPAMRGHAFAALNIAEGKAQPAASEAPEAQRLPPFHEFTLVPIKREPSLSSAGEGGHR